VYNRQVKKPAIPISEAEAIATNIAALLDRVRAGTEIIIEIEKQPIAIFRAVEPPRRTIAECIALMPEDSTATIDPDFSKDVRAAVQSQREPLNPPTWD
jgi:antitoxin (DNA-binding transcriptional repressor) of toxin-antitoxin stability system